MSVRPISVGLDGDRSPSTTTTTANGNGATVFDVASTAASRQGKPIAFVAQFEISGGKHDGGLTLIIASVTNRTEFTTITPVKRVLGSVACRQELKSTEFTRRR